MIEEKKYLKKTTKIAPQGSKHQDLYRDKTNNT